jgi:hypothetical protein
LGEIMVGHGVGPGGCAGCSQEKCPKEQWLREKLVMAHAGQKPWE